MSKFCPDIDCEFYEDFPDGLKSKKSKVCPSCLKLLVVEKPTEVTIYQDDQTLLLTDTSIQPSAGIHSSERSESARPVPAVISSNIIGAENSENSQENIIADENIVTYPDLSNTASPDVVNEQPRSIISSDITSQISDVILPTNPSVDIPQLNTSKVSQEQSPAHSALENKSNLTESTLSDDVSQPSDINSTIEKENIDIDSEGNGLEILKVDLDLPETLSSNVEVTTYKSQDQDQDQLAESFTELRIPSEGLSSGNSSPVLPPPQSRPNVSSPEKDTQYKPISGKKRNPSESLDDAPPSVQKSKVDSDLSNPQDGVSCDGKMDIELSQGDAVRSKTGATDLGTEILSESEQNSISGKKRNTSDCQVDIMPNSQKSKIETTQEEISPQVKHDALHSQEETSSPPEKDKQDTQTSHKEDYPLSQVDQDAQNSQEAASPPQIKHDTEDSKGETAPPPQGEQNTQPLHEKNPSLSQVKQGKNAQQSQQGASHELSEQDAETFHEEMSPPPHKVKQDAQQSQKGASPEETSPPPSKVKQDEQHSQKQATGKYNTRQSQDTEPNEKITGVSKSKIDDNYAKSNSKNPAKVDSKFQTSDSDKLEVLTEMDPNDANYCCIDIKTLIWKEYWDKVDTVCLRIGLKHFNNFKTSIVPFREINRIRLNDFEFVVINGILKYPTSLITRQKSDIHFAYKYYLHLKDDSECFEKLSHKSGDFNRFLRILVDKYSKEDLVGKTFPYIDIMILPEISKKSKGYWNQIVSFFSGKDPFLDISERRLLSLQALLPSYLEFGSLNPCSTMEIFLSEFHRIVKELIYIRIVDLNHEYSAPRFWNYFEQDSEQNMVKLVETWLGIKVSPAKNGNIKLVLHKFYLACYLICNYKIKNDKLNLQIIHSVEDCVEDILRKKVPPFSNEISKDEQFILTLQTAIVDFIFKSVMKSNNREKMIPLLPLYHIVNDLREHTLYLQSKLEYWDNEYWGFPEDCEILWQEGIAAKIIENAMRMVQYDPILPYSIMIYTLNERNVQLFIDLFLKYPHHIQLSTFMSVLLFHLNKAKKQYNYEHSIRKDSKLWISVITSLATVILNEKDKIDIQDIKNLNELTFLFIRELPLHFVDEPLFRLILELIFNGVTAITSASQDTLPVSLDSSKYMFEKFFIPWVVKNKTNSHFNPIYYRDFERFTKFLDDILMKYSLPSSLKWFDMIEKFLNVQLQNWDIRNQQQQYVVDIFILLHDKNKHSQFLQELFRKEITERIHGVSSGDRQLMIKVLSEALRGTEQFSKVSNIFSKILLDESKEFEKDPINHFIKWSSWGTYFQFLSSNDIQTFLSEPAYEMLVSASEQFMTIIDLIYHFQLSIKGLNQIFDGENHFIELVVISLKIKRDPKIILPYTTENIQVKLQNCKDALNWANSQKNLVLILHQFFFRYENINQESILEFVSKDLDEILINDLCYHDGTKFTFRTYPAINIIVNFPNISQMTQITDQLMKSETFIKIFEKHLIAKGVKSENPFDIEVLHKEVWVPALEFSAQLRDRFMQQTIMISEICEYFSDLSNRDGIINDLKNLDFGCKLFHDLPTDNNNLLLPCVDKIQIYHSLQQCSLAAGLIIQLKNALSLSSDFHLIENLIDSKQTFLKRPLREVTEQVNNTARSLGAITGDGIDVIKTFVARIHFIEWVKKNMNDLNDVKTFVDISLSTCGGNPVDIDRITCLSSVCTNFAPLIFQLNENTTFDTLIARCKEVIASVEKNRELTKLLKQIGDSIIFWEEMKKSHGSVEETTIMQLDSITRSGEFSIKMGNSLNINEILTLSVKRQDSENKIYSLDHLRELRSKLMLVVSKTSVSHSDSYTNAQHFNICLDTLTEIASIVIQLAETGNQHFFRYQYLFAFNKEKEILFDLKSELLYTLDIWRQNVEEARKDCYFLNYYTISQIVSLQKGIDSFIENAENNDVEQLYHLLRLLNHDITREDIEQALLMSKFINQAKLPTRTIPISKQEHSKQSIATVLSTQFPHSTRTPSKFSASSLPISPEPSFPDTFTDTEKDIAEKVSQDGDFPLSLTIRGIVDLKDKDGFVTYGSLTKWCMDIEDETDSLSEMDTVSEETDLLPISTEPDHSQTDISTDFHRLGKFLEEVHRSSGSKLRAEREFLYDLDKGEPNLVILPSARIFEFVLSLYMSDLGKLPLPQYHEVLVCSAHTKQEEIDIFWRRALMISERNNLYLFCLVNIDTLQYEVAVEAVSKFRIYQQCTETVGNRYKLVLVCSEEKEDLSYMAAAFEDYKKAILTFPKSEDVKLFLSSRFFPIHLRATLGTREPAWMVDKDRSRVRLVVSESVGAGKSLYVSNLVSDMLSQGVVREEEREEAAVTVAIHGKQASEEMLTGELLDKRVSSADHGHLFHVDIASTVQLGLEPILFKLLVLGGVSKRTGELWHCRRNDYYVIEMTLNSKVPTLTNFIRLYPIVQCVQPFEAIQTNTGDRNTQTSDMEEMRKAEYQRVYAYLKELESGGNLDIFTFQPNIREKFVHVDTLSIIFKYCGIVKPSWAELRNFVSFLDKQLSDCDQSDYCVFGIMEQEWKGFKPFVVKFMIHMSRDFATPSLEKENEYNVEDYLAMFEIIERRKWENNSHPYIFFNPDRHTMTFLGFHITNQGHLVNSDDPTCIIENNIMQPQLLQILTANRVNLQENYSSLSKLQKIMKIASVIGTDWLADPDPGYVLTLDNVRKILAILMRFRCNIPVVIMGETGCGKTRLIQFMCALQALQTGAKNMLILKVHGGTTEKDVMDKVMEAEALAVENSLSATVYMDDANSLNIDTVLFFDEANTSPAIGLIKEIMCDRRMYGRKIRTDIGLQFIAACNPYRKHSTEMLNKLSSAGLGFFTEASRTTDRLGDIPLRELVYRVMELPASMRPLVWDFGQLSNDIERTYTREIVAKHLRDRSSPIDANDGVVDVITEVLSSAQNFMRGRKDECSFVSLRDVERAMTVMLWFYSKLEYFRPDEDADITSDKSSVSEDLSDTEIETEAVRTEDFHAPPFIGEVPQPLPATKHSDLIDFGATVPIPAELRKIQRRGEKSINNIDFITYSLILSLAVCYRARLQEREEFDKHIRVLFKPPLTPLRDYQVISKEVDRCQQILLDEMIVGKNIAKNTALKENVFMMFVCIELKIPLFVIGKPGSSKSLAKSIISNSMQGGHCSEGSILKNFKQVQIMSYQCSQLSTADGIISVFRSCRNLQRKTGSNKFVACVVLDEVGLAEDSPLLPLKVLHPLLEDSSFGSEDFEDPTELDEQSQRVEMMDEDDTDEMITESNDMKNRVAFIGISNWSLDPAKMNRGIMVSRGDPDIDELISSAQGICQSEHNRGRGSIIKSIESKIKYLAKAYKELTCQNTKAGEKKNREYYGLRDFYSLIKMLVFLCNEEESNLTPAILEHAVLRNFGGVSDVDPVKIFLKTVKLANIGKQGPDSSPLGLIRANLTNLTRSFHGETRYLLLLTENYSALNILLQSPDMWPKKNDIDNIRVIFGSSFPSDLEYSAVCRNINNIKVCMESGKTIVLLNLENLYESLYDALNQYYMELNNQRYVDLGLGTHRMKCRVHNDFKLIVIADRETVQERFPTPLINRLEKHFLTMSTVLTDEGRVISDLLRKWAKDFSTLDRTHSIGFQKRCEFSEGDCFIGYHADTASSIVFHVMKAMYPDGTTDDLEVDREAVLERSQIQLLRMATTDAVLRVNNSYLRGQSQNIMKEYFKLQLGSLEEYLRQALDTFHDDTRKHLTLATTHSRLLTDRDVNQLKKRLNEEINEIKCLSLQQFQSEQQFSSEIQKFLRAEIGSERAIGPGKRILLVQCDKGTENAKLIACARHKTVEELSDWREESENEECGVCLVFLVQLRREAHGSSFESFCGGEWNTVHIDDIRSLDYEELPPISEIIGKEIHQMFGGFDDSQVA